MTTAHYVTLADPTDTAVRRRPGSLLDELDLDKAQFLDLIEAAARHKRAKRDGYEVPWLGGRNFALIFEKASTRTRCWLPSMPIFTLS